MPSKQFIPQQGHEGCQGPTTTRPCLGPRSAGQLFQLFSGRHDGVDEFLVTGQLWRDVPHDSSGDGQSCHHGCSNPPSASAAAWGRTHR